MANGQDSSVVYKDSVIEIYADGGSDSITNALVNTISIIANNADDINIKILDISKDTPYVSISISGTKNEYTGYYFNFNNCYMVKYKDVYLPNIELLDITKISNIFYSQESISAMEVATIKYTGASTNGVADIILHSQTQYLSNIFPEENIFYGLSAGDGGYPMTDINDAKLICPLDTTSISTTTYILCNSKMPFIGCSFSGRYNTEYSILIEQLGQDLTLNLVNYYNELNDNTLIYNAGHINSNLELSQNCASTPGPLPETATFKSYFQFDTQYSDSWAGAGNSNFPSEGDSTLYKITVEVYNTCSGEEEPASF